MTKIKDALAVSCDECKGAGFLFWGHDGEFEVMPCDCVNDGSLFWNGEND